MTDTSPPATEFNEVTPIATTRLKLPLEVIKQVFTYLGNHDLATCLRLSKSTYDAAGILLYHTIVIDDGQYGDNTPPPFLGIFSSVRAGDSFHPDSLKGRLLAHVKVVDLKAHLPSGHWFSPIPFLKNLVTLKIKCLYYADMPILCGIECCPYLTNLRPKVLIVHSDTSAVVGEILDERYENALECAPMFQIRPYGGSTLLEDVHTCTFVPSPTNHDGAYLSSIRDLVHDLSTKIEKAYIVLDMVPYEYWMSPSAVDDLDQADHDDIGIVVHPLVTILALLRYASSSQGGPLRRWTLVNADNLLPPAIAEDALEVARAAQSRKEVIAGIRERLSTALSDGGYRYGPYWSAGSTLVDIIDELTFMTMEDFISEEEDLARVTLDQETLREWRVKMASDAVATGATA